MTWATKEDLYARFGEKYINELGIRSNWSETAKAYVASESQTDIDKVLDLAIEDAKNLILQKLSCLYSDYQKVNTIDFPVLKQWHIQLIIDVLKIGGNCLACDCTKLDEFLCKEICTPDGVCLRKNVTAISVSIPHYPCEACGCEVQKCCCH